MASDTFINGNRVSFADTTMSAGGFDINIGLQSINWNSSLDPGMIQSNSVFAAGRTSGFYTGTADFELLVSESDDFEDDLTDSGNTGLLQTDFDIQLQYALSDESYVETINLRGCRIKTRGVSASNSNEALKMKYELTVMRIERNGRPDVIQ